MNVIIYSPNRQDPYRCLKLLNANMHRDCEYVTTAHKLLESLDKSRYDLIILSAEDYAGLDVTIRERIGAMKGLSVLLLRDVGEKHDQDIFMAMEGVPCRKMVLHKGEENADVQSQRDREIIRATAATLGHEINNPLMSICASAEMILKENPALSTGVVEKIKHISDEAVRIKKSTDILIDVDRVLLKKTPAGNMIDIHRIKSGKENEEICGEILSNKNLDIKSD